MRWSSKVCCAAGCEAFVPCVRCGILDTGAVCDVLVVNVDSGFSFCGSLRELIEISVRRRIN